MSDKIEMLSKMKATIEQMDKNNQIEVLRLLHKNNAILNENKNGIHINLTELQESTLINIFNFVEYINTQENKLNDDEYEKQKYKNMFFCK
jgi:hypothetical protein